MIGTVEQYNKTLRFGFVRSDEFNKLYFVHFTDILDDVKELEVGEKVDFKETYGSRGPQAIMIKKISQ